MKLTDKDSAGTSFYDATITATPQQLIDVFGEPQYFSNNGNDKTNMDYVFEDEDGNVVTLYDWKEYSPLKMDKIYTFHIGGYDSYTTHLAKAQIEKMLGK